MVKTYEVIGAIWLNNLLMQGNADATDNPVVDMDETEAARFVAAENLREKVAVASAPSPQEPAAEEPAEPKPKKGK